MEMEMNANNSNRIIVHGSIVGNPDYSHSVGQERFLRGNIKVNRISGNSDILPFMISERLAPDWALGDGDEVALIGQIRSHNVFDNPNGKSRLDVVIFVREIAHGSVVVTPTDSYNGSNTMNIAELTGNICKAPVYRVTPFGREICDMMLVVNRAFGKSDYIPCIAWGRNAKYVSAKLKVGDAIKIKGRFQSREYSKTYSDGSNEMRTAYEVSVFELFS